MRTRKHNRQIPRAVHALRSAGWSPEEIAETLGIGRTTVYRHLDRLGRAAQSVRADAGALRARLELESVS